MMRIVIDLNKTLPENANEYYEKAKKMKKKILGAESALKETIKKKAEINIPAADEKKGSPPIRKIEKKRWYEHFRYFKTKEGLLVVGGKDASTNEILIKKHTEPADLVFHADIHGAPFFVIKNPDRMIIGEETIGSVANIAASYSSAWKQNIGSVDVYYVRPEQVQKKAPSGEYLGKGAFMIYGKKTWARNANVAICIGFDEKEIVAGDEKLVASKTARYALITPGDMQSIDLAKKIKEILIEKSENKETMKSIPLESIQKYIPGGSGRIMHQAP